MYLVISQVAAALGNFIDGGSTVIGNAARVAKSKKGTGVWSVMKNYDDPDPRYQRAQTFAGATPRWDIHRKFWKHGEGTQLIQIRVNSCVFLELHTILFIMI